MSETTTSQENYSHVSMIARIACYDDLRSAPRVVEIDPDETSQFIENLASKTYELAKLSGGSIPYTVIREVSENFIHARFNEIVVSILDNGNTIRFADQGPGISQKEKAQLPGFTSATEPMKRYIRGVGSGLPIVREYLDNKDGFVVIDDNIGSGAVVTISLNPEVIALSPDGSSDFSPSRQSLFYQPRERIEGSTRAANESSHPNRQEGFNSHPYAEFSASPHKESLARKTALMPPLSKHGRLFLPLLLSEGELGVTDLSRLTNVAISSTHAALKKLEEAGLVKRMGKKRILTEYGYEVARRL